ncbi:uncharacterized protein DUF4142 [Advenella incenata]|jgi:putative membrane protein|uniref:Uncharacterized protein DUF4142 n=1 Tax=Advenella incenata TaxID=267800 RepID=A0A4Q7VVB3_9BURK|nr:DUF4142 domain-containing protein [Advenella incenata]RZU00415.1 uncharacterized protein DUF4142 [Advenella incenata]
MKSTHIGWILLAALSGCASTAKNTGPADAQIAAIVVTANQVDVDAGELSTSTPRLKDVRSFANLMITDHNAVNRSATALVQKLNVQPEPG